MSDLISIVMPAFKVEDHLMFFCWALDSIMRQTYTNWELIIVCDGRFGSTRKHVIKQAKRLDDDRVRVFWSDEHNGPGIARNLALQYTNGKFITFHDTDDYSNCDRLEKLIGNMDPFGIVASKVCIKQALGLDKKIKGYPGGNLLSALIEHKKVKAPFHLSSALMSRDLFYDIGGFERFMYSSDSIMAIKLGLLRDMMQIPPITILDEPLFLWYRRFHSITTWKKHADELAKNQKDQRDPVLNEFRDMFIRGDIKIGDDVKDIKEALSIKNNLSDLETLNEVAWRNAKKAG